MANPTSRPHPRPDLPQATWDAIQTVIGGIPALEDGSRPGFVRIAKACRAARRAGQIQGCSNQQLDAALKYLADAGELDHTTVRDDSTPEPVAAPKNDPLRININRFLDVAYDEQVGRARVLVGGKPFLHCSFIVTTFPVGDDIPQIDSIEDCAMCLKHDARVLEHLGAREWLTPAEEVLAHASNLQAWAENGYDMRLLHKNIAFPLLMELANAGDENAKRILDSEIGIRIREGNLATQITIVNTVLDYIRDPELLKILLENKDLVESDEEKSKYGEERYVDDITKRLERLVREGNTRARETRDDLLASLPKRDSPTIAKIAIVNMWGDQLTSHGFLEEILENTFEQYEAILGNTSKKDEYEAGTLISFVLARLEIMASVGSVAAKYALIKGALRSYNKSGPYGRIGQNFLIRVIERRGEAVPEEGTDELYYKFIRSKLLADSDPIVVEITRNCIEEASRQKLLRAIRYMDENWDHFERKNGCIQRWQSLITVAKLIIDFLQTRSYFDDWPSWFYKEFRTISSCNAIIDTMELNTFLTNILNLLLLDPDPIPEESLLIEKWKKVID